MVKRTNMGFICLSVLADLFSWFFLLFCCCRHFYVLTHTCISTHTQRQMYTQKVLHTDTQTHTQSLVLSQLMKWLVRCPMCRTHGSLPIHWITVNRCAHSSADMIVLMDDSNIQTAVQTWQLWMDACIFLGEREKRKVCLIFSPYTYILTLICVCVCFFVLPSHLGASQTASPTP